MYTVSMCKRKGTFSNQGQPQGSALERCTLAPKLLHACIPTAAMNVHVDCPASVSNPLCLRCANISLHVGAATPDDRCAFFLISTDQRAVRICSCQRFNTTLPCVQHNHSVPSTAVMAVPISFDTCSADQHKNRRLRCIQYQMHALSYKLEA